MGTTNRLLPYAERIVAVVLFGNGDAPTTSRTAHGWALQIPPGRLDVGVAVSVCVNAHHAQI